MAGPAGAEMGGTAGIAGLNTVIWPFDSDCCKIASFLL